ncbi:MAG TPA: DUF881 domain-containing protein [Jiangellaceae bacterium]|nr:DUF881 domain-containing protein [Jiangellaceae bacterium]
MSSVRSWRFAAPVALAACGVLLVLSARAADGGDLRGSGHAELGDLVREAELRGEELSQTAEQLRAEIDALSNDDGLVKSGDQQQVEEFAELAGLTPVEGPGLQVTLSDAPDPGGLAADQNLEDYIVHQQDLEAVINALWAGGAEAMMVMDQRIIATSSVKCIGPVLYLQGRRYGPPYVISAIGDVNEMNAALDESPGVTEYRTYADQIGLGFGLEVQENISMPAYEGPLGVSAETAE